MKKTDIIIKESNAVARARIEPKVGSVWEERIIALLLAKIRIEDKAFCEEIIPFSELGEGDRLSTREYAEAKRAINSLAHKVFKMPNGWRGVKNRPIFENLDIDDDGNIEAKLNQGLGEHYLELEGQFALRSLPEFRALSGTYAQQLYRFLNSWKNAGEVRVELTELHELLSTPESFKEFANFRLRVLEPVAKELNAKTSLKYDWKTICKGRGGKVIAIKFTFPQPKETTKTPKEKPIRQAATVETPKPKPEDILTPEQMAADIAKFKAERGA